MTGELHVVGGGLAGAEAAWQAARRGLHVVLHEMRPVRCSPAHSSNMLAELVCSNSFKSSELTSGAGLLKAELRILGSLLIHVAEDVKVPAGTSLTVDREKFAKAVTERLDSCPGLTVVREEVREIPEWRPCVLATGPLTSDSLSKALAAFVGRESLYFYDALAPIVDTDSIDMSIVFAASRYGKGDGGYLNCPLTEEQYGAFWKALVGAETVELREVDKGYFFEGCLPLEELAARGFETMAFGPLRPVGLAAPSGGARPFAVLQLRPENRDNTMYGLVGCQTRMTQGEQKRVFRMVPGLKDARFLRYGAVHRNTYVDSPRVVDQGLMARRSPGLFLAGQLVGGEGYTEAVATGLLAGVNAWRVASGREAVVPPPATAIGALVRYISGDQSTHFAPMNFNFGLLPRVMLKGARRRKQVAAERALEALEAWKKVEWDEARS
jgi:methylenetetrahydrofolate--tRNA-(uracil-5-)-methyltransferase